MFHRDGPTLLELARQALSSTERGYDLLAPKFDHTPFRTPDEVVAAAVEAALSETGVVDDALDLCCGTGAGLLALRPRCRRRLVGVDFSAGMLDVARDKLAAEPAAPHPRATPVELLQADVRALPFREAFDLATCFGALGHITGADETPFLRSVHDALRPGGRFVFATAERPPPLSAASLLSRAFNAAMRVRNAVWRPRFVMVYLTFMLPEVRDLMARHGFAVEVVDAHLDAPMDSMRVVIATKR